MRKEKFKLVGTLYDTDDVDVSLDAGDELELVEVMVSLACIVIRVLEEISNQTECEVEEVLSDFNLTCKKLNEVIKESKKVVS